MKRVVKHLEENGKSDQVADFKKNITAAMPKLLGKFKDLQFFSGESYYLVLLAFDGLLGYYSSSAIYL